MIRLPDLYVTFDKESFFDLQVHIGRFRLECGSTTPKDRGSTPEQVHGQSASKGPTGL